MPTVGTSSKPAYVYDAGTDTWIPIGPGEHTHAYVEKSTLTTTGDIIYASAANTPARLGIGSNGQYLTISSGLPSWGSVSAGAGNMVQVATGTLSGTSVTLSSLSSYTDLSLSLEGVTTGGSFSIRIRLNNNSGSNYKFLSLQGAYRSGTFERDSQVGTASTAIDIPANWNQYNNGNNNWFLKFTNCKNAGFTDFDGIASARDSATTDSRHNFTLKGIYTQSEAISSIVISTPTGATFNGGTYILWGA